MKPRAGPQKKKKHESWCFAGHLGVPDSPDQWDSNQPVEGESSRCNGYTAGFSHLSIGSIGNVEKVESRGAIPITSPC